MKYRIHAFLAGRNGIDALSGTLSWIAIIGMIVSFFIPIQWLRNIVYYLSIIIFVYAYFRVFSRNIVKRRAENAAFIGFFTRKKLQFQQRKTHKFYRCPKCGATLRVPKGKGKIQIICNRCGEQFVKKT
ncbi:MAG: hypothetical protein LUE11_07710 [Clostridia bacterium]|nr:hypothetical protein [Clostridia bacterium]